MKFINTIFSLVKKQLPLLKTGLFLIFICSNCMSQDNFDAKLRSILDESVPFTHADELKENIEKERKLVILDTRSRDEYNVSHLRGAKWIDYDGFTAEMVENIDRDAPVVVYCSVGYRSEKIGEKLRDMGFSNVKNLYGGIFDWKNKGNTVINSSGSATDTVHTYNKAWSKWLKNGVGIYE